MGLAVNWLDPMLPPTFVMLGKTLNFFWVSVFQAEDELGKILSEISLNYASLATSCKELTPWKRPWSWEGLGAGGEGDDRGWDGWMASLTRWTRVWVNSGSWWWTWSAWSAAIHGVAKSQTRLSDWTELSWCIFTSGISLITLNISNGNCSI